MNSDLMFRLCSCPQKTKVISYVMIIHQQSIENVFIPDKCFLINSDETAFTVVEHNSYAVWGTRDIRFQKNTTGIIFSNLTPALCGSSREVNCFQESFIPL